VLGGELRHKTGVDRFGEPLFVPNAK